MSFQEQVRQLILRLHEVERFQLERALYDLFVADLDYHEFQESRLQANNVVAAYLNTMTSIRDQATNIEAPKGEFRFREKFRREWDKTKSNSAAFRLACRYRVYSQHQSQATTGITSGGGWDEEMVRCETHITINASLSEICENRDIKKAERDEYKEIFGEKIDVGFLLRSTSSEIAKITKSSIREIREEIDSSMRFLTEFIDKYSSLGSRMISLGVLSDNRVVESFVVFDNLVERVRGLLNFRLLENYELHFVSNRDRGHERSPKFRSKFVEKY
jgi:hypothetical protein